MTLVNFNLGQSPLPYALVYLIPLAAVWGMHTGGAWTYIVAYIAFILVPLLDMIFGLDDYNPTSKDEERRLNAQFSFRVLTWLWVPAQYATILYAGHFIATHPHLHTYEFLGIAMSVGIIGGLGINVGHELIHKPGVFEQMLGKALLVSTCYGHFYIEHIQGHHKRVSTRHDPASSRFNESVYAFLPRSIIGGYLSAAHLEEKRLAAAGKSSLSIHNQMHQFFVLSLAWLTAMRYLFGSMGAAFFVVQSIVAFTLLEFVNYVEHYGLERAEDARVTPMHSWNAGHRISNYLLFKLQRHSDHHANAGRRYQILRSFEASPQLPASYSGAILASLIPPLWFAIMNPRVIAARKANEYYETHGIDPFASYKAPLIPGEQSEE